MTHGNLPPAGWYSAPDDPSRWRWWDGARWTDHHAPRQVGDAGANQAESTPAGGGAKRRSRFMRELVGSQEVRAAARAERLTAREEATAVLKSSLRSAREGTPQPRGSHQGSTPSIQQVLEELRPEPLREYLDEQVEVAGETYFVSGIKKVFRTRGAPIPQAGIELNDVHCVLVPTPWNTHDANAIAVVVEGQQVGHLPAQLAATYAGPLANIARSGYLVTGTGRMWAKDDGAGVVRARVTILIPEASGL